MKTSNIALGFRTPVPSIKALSYKMEFGKYKGFTIEEIIKLDPGYILWMSDEKIAKVSDEILNYGEEAETDERFSEAMDGELMGMRFWDFFDDD